MIVMSDKQSNCSKRIPNRKRFFTQKNLFITQWLFVHLSFQSRLLQHVYLLQLHNIVYCHQQCKEKKQLHIRITVGSTHSQGPLMDFQACYRPRTAEQSFAGVLLLEMNSVNNYELLPMQEFYPCLPLKYGSISQLGKLAPVLYHPVSIV